MSGYIFFSTHTKVSKRGRILRFLRIFTYYIRVRLAWRCSMLGERRRWACEYGERKGECLYSALTKFNCSYVVVRSSCSCCCSSSVVLFHTAVTVHALLRLVATEYLLFMVSTVALYEQFGSFFVTIFFCNRYF